MDEKVKSWLAEQLTVRGWSHSELARRAGVSQAAVSGTISGDRKAGCDFLIKVALALEISPEYLLRLADILPPSSPSPDDATTQELIELARSLSPENREELLQYARFRYLQEQGKKIDRT